MTKTAQKLKKELAALSSGDREEILEFLRDLQDGEVVPDESEEWAAELERRWKEVESGKDPGIPGEQVFAELRAKYSCDRFRSSEAVKHTT